MQNGEVADAVFYLKKAAQTEKSDIYSLELAKTLSMISQYEQSNLIYIKLLAKGSKVGNCCFGLSQNLYYLNELEHSLYYLNLYMDKYADYNLTEEEDEYIDIIEEADIYEGYSIVYPVEKQDMGPLINQARGYMKKGLFDKAKSLFDKVPEKNSDYLFARNNMALCSFFTNDYKSTKKYCHEVLKADKQNIFALCNLAAMYNYTEDEANTSKYLNKFINIKTDDISDLFKIATTLCELKEHALALKYLKKLSDIKPYDSGIMFLTAIAYYNNKMIKQAIDLFLKIIRLDERNYAAKYYLKLIRQISEEKDGEKGFFQPLEYICQVPYGEMLTRIKFIKSITAEQIKSMTRQKISVVLKFSDWCFTLSDLKLQKAVTVKLFSAINSDIERFFREKLIDPSVNNGIKRLIIENFILQGIQTKYVVCIDYVVKSLNPVTEIAQNKRGIFYEAYALCCSTLLMFMSQKTEKEIYKAYRGILTAAKKRGIEAFTDKKSLAAVMAYRSKGGSSKVKKNMCRIFNADIITLEKYDKLL